MFTAAISPTRRWPKVLACPARRSRARWRREEHKEFSGREISLADLDSVGVKRPVVKRLRFAEFSLCQFGGLVLIRSVNFQRALTNFCLSAVFAEHVLHETNDKP